MQVIYHSTAFNQGNLKIKIEENDFKADVNKEIEQIRKKAKIKGFRQGAVPYSMISKLYGESIKAEILNKIINKAVEEYQLDNKINFIGDILPHEDSNKSNIDSEEFEFLFDVGIAPEVNLDKFIQDHTLPKFSINISDKELETEKEAFLNHFSQFNETDSPIEEKDMVKLKVSELQDGMLKEGGIVSDFSVLLDEHIGDELRKDLLNKKTGDQIRINIRKVEKELDDKAIRKYFLKIDEDKEFEDFYNANIESVSRKLRPELNEELYKKAYGEDTSIQDEEGLKNRLKDDLQSHYNGEAESYLNYFLYKKIIEWKELQYPDTFLKAWLVKTFDEWKNKSDHDFEHDFIHYKEGLNWQLFKNTINQKEKITVEAEFVKNIIINRYQEQIPGLNFTQEQWNQIASNVLSDKEKAKEFITEASNFKTQEWLRNQMSLEEINITIEEFKEKVKALKAHIH
ncbi:MAG: hypothetical protein IT267_04920 [Saprospiraceae bacterium]|nr:hypothetical protein [Saprospiraceae bacterium]